jgi:fimbrial chaperone protein
MGGSHRLRKVLGVLALGWGSLAIAQEGGGISVNPIRLEMQPGARAISLTLGNGEDRARSVQVEALRWTQVDGRDVYEPAPELVVNPPVFRVAPGARQIVRAGFRAGAPSAPVETAYRLYLQEMPDSGDASDTGLRLLLRIGVPLFVEPAGRSSARPQWQVQRAADGTTSLHLINDGNRRMRLDALRLRDASGQDVSMQELTYVLPGQSHRWALPAQLQGPLRLAATSDTGPLDVALPLP